MARVSLKIKLTPTATSAWGLLIQSQRNPRAEIVAAVLRTAHDRDAFRMELPGRGHARVEVEDRAYEGSLDDRKRALRQSRKFLEQFVG